jgi:ribosomal-protein-alanine N-acetyltransferase
MDPRWALVTTERLRLRRVTSVDVPALAAISRDPRTNVHRPGGAPSRARSEEIIGGFISDWEQHGLGYWVVEYLGEVVGIAGVRSISLCGRDCWNLYYRFSPDAWGKGLAAEAAGMAIVVARECDPNRPILARTRPDNVAAARLAQAIGMTRSPEWDEDGFVAFAHRPSDSLRRVSS